MSYTPGPDDAYYEDWALSFDDGWKPSPPAQIDLAKVVIFLWIILGTLLGCQSDRSGQQPSCVFGCVLTAKPDPVPPPVAARPDFNEEIIIPPSRRSTVIRRFAP